MSRLLTAVTVMLIISRGVVYSHPGRTDSRGGHNDRKNGGYHFHNKPAPVTPSEIYGVESDKEAEPASRAIGLYSTGRMASTPRVRTEARSSYRSTFTAEDSREKLAKEFGALPAPPEKPFVDRERQAKAKLGLGQQMLSLGKRDNAAQWFAQVVQDFPETESAKEADQLYMKVTGKKYAPKEQLARSVGREAEAAELLKKCQELAKNGSSLDAIRWLTELLLKYPDTKAAATATELYRELSGHDFERGLPRG
jgi:tetratricopeptide (TPR) repeat protein